jgi:predicted MPP superfamily phosphohydrolase
MVGSDGASVSDESATEALHIRVGGRQFAVTARNPLKVLFGDVLELLGRLPLITLHSRHIAPRGLRLETVRVGLPTVTPGLAGLRVGFITDIHHEPGRPIALLERAIRLLREESPDLILLGGDYVNSVARDFDRPRALLAKLRAPLGVYGVLGNHDYWAGGDYLAARLAGIGVTMLRNESRHLRAPGGAGFWLVGVDSAVRRHDDLEGALAPIPADEFRLLLAHEPEVADMVTRRRLRVDLQLSGHSHGGQVVLPRIGAPMLPRLGRRYIRGLHTAPPIYTSRGLGAVPPYLRFNSPPEVTIITLARPENPPLGRGEAPPAYTATERHPTAE